MQSKSIVLYIKFGTVLRYLQDAKTGWPFHGNKFVKDNINWFFGYLKDFNLIVTSRASEELREFYNELNEFGEDHKLTADQASRLSSMMTDIRKTLEAEARGNIAFIVSDKRIDVNKLLSSVETLMSPNIYILLPEVAQYDFNEAGKCIAFERPTAAAFHILRGTEAVLRFFYCTLVKKKRVSPLLWGPILTSLRKRRVPPLEMLNNLDNIRLSFRNPTQHPEKIYDIQEVQDLFSLCVDVINRMISYLKSQKLIDEQSS